MPCDTVKTVNGAFTRYNFPYSLGGGLLVDHGCGTEEKEGGRRVAHNEQSDLARHLVVTGQRSRDSRSLPLPVSEGQSWGGDRCVSVLLLLVVVVIFFLYAFTAPFKKNICLHLLPFTHNVNI